MIQLINYSGLLQDAEASRITVNKIQKPDSLDSYDINLIDMTDSHIWINDKDSLDSVNCQKDIDNLSKMVDMAEKTKVVIVLPQDLVFKYYYGYDHNRAHAYIKGENIRNIPSKVKYVLTMLRNLPVELVYENTKTKILKSEVPATFCFKAKQNQNVLTRSEGSEKATTICQNDLVITALELNTYDRIYDFCKKIGWVNDERKDCPDWMKDIKMFDDLAQIDIIRDNREIIQRANLNIDRANQIIEKNNRMKSILYTSGDELVSVVLEILQEMLGCSFADFVDKKNEDFLSTVDGHTFIGEIKGVNHNVKSENVSQLDVHYQSYLEDHPEVCPENVHALLIMDHQKNKPLQNREPVHEKQIALARRNGSLIVETYTLLRIYEKYLAGEMERKQCISLFSDNIGLLRL